jgi:hypothetical protein
VTREVPVERSRVQEARPQRALGGGGADAVLDDGSGLEADTTTLRAEPVAEVDVLDEQPVAGVEPADRVEVAAPDSEGAAGHPVDVAGLGHVGPGQVERVVATGRRVVGTTQPSAAWASAVAATASAAPRPDASRPGSARVARRARPRVLRERADERLDRPVAEAHVRVRGDDDVDVGGELPTPAFTPRP